MTGMQLDRRNPNWGLDPVAIRVSLQESRAEGMPFEQAWRLATGRIADEPEVVSFMLKHFRAAYYNTGEGAGRCMVPERDTSTALRGRRDYKRCQSGDGCEHPAVRGRFGVKWCEYHGAELERLAVKVAADTVAANPRVNRNANTVVRAA